MNRVIKVQDIRSLIENRQFKHDRLMIENVKSRIVYDNTSFLIKVQTLTISLDSSFNGEFEISRGIFYSNEIVIDAQVPTLITSFSLVNYKLMVHVEHNVSLTPFAWHQLTTLPDITVNIRNPTDWMKLDMKHRRSKCPIYLGHEDLLVKTREDFYCEEREERHNITMIMQRTWHDITNYMITELRNAAS